MNEFQLRKRLLTIPEQRWHLAHIQYRQIRPGGRNRRAKDARHDAELARRWVKAPQLSIGQVQNLPRDFVDAGIEKLAELGLWDSAPPKNAEEWGQYLTIAQTEFGAEFAEFCAAISPFDTKLWHLADPKEPIDADAAQAPIAGTLAQHSPPGDVDRATASIDVTGAAAVDATNGPDETSVEEGFDKDGNSVIAFPLDQPVRPNRTHTAPTSGPANRSTESPDIMRALRDFAAWAVRERGVTHASSILALSPEIAVPQSALAAWTEFLAVGLDELADPALLRADINDLVSDVLSNFTANQREVLTSRVLSTAPGTLESIGRRCGVTRARVGQIQASVENRLANALAERRFLPLHWRAGDLSQALGAASPAHARSSIEALRRATSDCDGGNEVDTSGVLLHLAGPYRLRDGWYVRVGSSIPDGRALLKLADRYGIFHEDTVREWLAAHGVDPGHLGDWIVWSKQFRRFPNSLAIWCGSVIDKCVSVLAIRGAPADAEVLVTEIGEGHSVRSVRQRLFDDDRVVRVNRTEWALRDWGLEEYNTISEEIAQRIALGGGRVKVADLVTELVAQFGVNAGSVRVYAEAPRFVTEDGYVRLRGTDDGFDIDSNLSSCRGVFRNSASILSYVFPVDREVLRGSGRPCPEALAAELGVLPGTSRSFTTMSGRKLKVSWREAAALGPSLGSTRALADEAGAVEGHMLRLQLDVEQGACSAFDADALVGIDLPVQIEARTGVDAGADPTAAVARAIGVDAANVIDVLRRRGDGWLADVLPAPLVSDALHDALAELAETLDQLP